MSCVSCMLVAAVVVAEAAVAVAVATAEEKSALAFPPAPMSDKRGGILIDRERGGISVETCCDMLSLQLR